MVAFERHLFVILLWISTGVSFFAHLASDSSRLPIAGGLIVLLGAWLHAGHRVHVWVVDAVEQRTYLVACSGLIVLFAALVVVDASYLFMLFGVFSFLFGYSSDVRVAAWLSAVLTAIWVGAWLYHDLPSGAIATPIFVWGIANAINVLSTRISVQNRERGELIARLNATRDELAVAERERGVLEERSRLAREIHDTLAQGFTSVVLLSDAMRGQIDSMPRERIAESLSLLSSTARENLDDARRLIASETPAALDARSFVDALETLAEDVRRRTSAIVDVESPSEVSLGGSEEVVLFRVAQEACNNVVKYAEAERVSIVLEVGEDAAVLTVADDGVGFMLGSAASEIGGMSGGSGLGFMVDRARELDGMVEVESTPGSGTVVRVQVPIVVAR